ncbi:MAG TPA: HyaD/HybD family hydrogenase maturation endopeptidase [Vicinamibacterales bacterium]|jgi:hydrogenase maturation protease
MDSRSSLLILGLGNLLCTDDGAGAFVVQEIAETRVAPDGVRILDGGTLGLALLPYLEDAERAILVDAVQVDAPPGTVIRLEGEEVGPAIASHLSVHQVGVADLLDAARWRERVPPELTLLGVVPLSTELGYGLSAPVDAAFDDLVARVCQEAARLGFPLSMKQPHDHDHEGARLRAAVGDR